MIPEIDRVLTEVPHSVECRAGVCKIEIVQKDGEKIDHDALNADEKVHQLTAGRMMKAAQLRRDPITGESQHVWDEYLTVADPAAVRGMDVVGPVMKAFRESGVVSDCGRRYPGANGTVDANVAVAPETGLSIETAGTIINTEAGRCIDSALRAALSRISLPKSFEPASLHARYKLPVD
jgi:hypothetical protein